MKLEQIGKLRPIHPFPARMAPSIALAELERSANGSLRVLDPMMGSGTTVVLSRLMGHHAYGVDIDPLAVLQAKTWTSTAIREELERAANECLHRAKSIAEQILLRHAYPKAADDETKKFLRFWFDSQSRRQLTALSMAIGEADVTVRDFLNTVISRTIIAKDRGVSLARDLSHSRPHKVYVRAPVTPFAEFLVASRRILADLPFIEDSQRETCRQPESAVTLGDARAVKRKSNQFDLILTSPPYLNAIDYMRCSKFALVWMGYSISQLRETRRASIGVEIALPKDEVQASIDVLRQIPARKKLPERHARILDRYVVDMQLVVRETSRLLKDHGRAVFVVGDSRLKGVFVSNSRIVERLSELYELELVSRVNREIPANRRYLPPPASMKNSTLGARMGNEVILTFSRKKR